MAESWLSARRARLSKAATRRERDREPSPLEIAGSIFDVWSLRQPPRYRNEAAIRALCRTAYIGSDTSICRVLGRYRMFVDTTDVGFSTYMMLDGYWEMWTTEAMLGFITPGMTVLDIGANLGYFTLLMADLAGPSGRIHAFEPNPAIASRLRRTVSVNGYTASVTVHGCALGDTEGAVQVVVPPAEPKNAHVIPWRSDSGSEAVPVRRLDQIIDVDPDFIKIDVEGAEEAVWRGMSGILARNKPMTIFLEFTPGRYADPAAFLDEILAHGFALAVIDMVEGVRPTTRADVLAGPPADDQMLVLRR